MSNISIKKISVTALNVDAVVNAANSRLEKGGGVCGAIFREAGPKELAAVCRSIGGCKTGDAVITPGFKLKARYIIHAIGPIWEGGMNGEPTQLYNAYRSALELARRNEIHSIGFPLISAGIYGYPLEDAWRKALRACLTFIEDNPDYDIDITFAVLDEDILKLGQEILDITLYASNVELGKKPALVSPKLFPVAEEFFKRNLNLLKAVARDETLSSWFKEYDIYENSEGFEGLRAVLDREILRRAYDEGLIIRKYSQIIEESGLDEALVVEPTEEWLESLTKEQIIACVAFHYRRDHFSPGTLYSSSIGEGWLLKYFQRYLELE